VEVGSAPVPSEKVRVKPVRVRLRDNDLATDRLRGVGFRAVSSSGWEGPVRSSFRVALTDAHTHRAETS
jgi:hypothetical protein